MKINREILKKLIQTPDGKYYKYEDGKFLESLDKDGEIYNIEYGTITLNTIVKGKTVTKYYTDNKLHRLDGPAIERKNGQNEYYVNGKLHRLDGPAVIKKQYIFPCRFIIHQYFIDNQYIYTDGDENYVAYLKYYNQHFRSKSLEDYYIEYNKILQNNKEKFSIAVREYNLKSFK